MADRPRAGAPSRHPLLHWEFVVGAVLLVIIGAVGGTMLARSAITEAQAAAGAQPAQSRAVTQYPAASRTAPVELSGTTLQGDAVDIASFRGQVLVINVWGSWCAPCRVEAPILARASDAYADDGVQFLGINVRDNTAAALAFEDGLGIPYASIDDRDGGALLALVDHLPGAGVPVTLILDRDGRAAARVLGAVEESTLTALIDDVVSESAQGNTG